MSSAGFRIKMSIDPDSIIWILFLLIAFVFLKRSYGQVPGLTLEKFAIKGSGDLENASLTSTERGMRPVGICTEGFGIKADKGISSLLDLKVCFFRNIRQEINDGFNVVQIIPKIGKDKGRISIYLPVGIWQELSLSDKGMPSCQKIVFITPRLSGKILKVKHFDACAGIFFEFISSRMIEGNSTYGLTIGLGWSSPSRDWFLRSELGMAASNRAYLQPVCSIGITVGYNIFPSTNSYRDITATHDRFYTSLANLTCLSTGF